LIQAGTRVECYSGSEYAEYPRAFDWQGLRLVVAEILQRRRTPSGKTFRLRAADGQVYDLSYDEMSQDWQAVLA
jgi:hypothetical protein